MFICKLRAPGNPDHAQYADVAPRAIVRAATLEAIRDKCMEYIAEWNLGGGNWTFPYVTNEKGEKVARITYGGRIVMPGDKYFDD